MQETVLQEGVTYLGEDPGAAQPAPKREASTPRPGEPRAPADALSGSAAGTPEEKQEDKQPTSWAPHPKVASGGLAGLIAIPLLWLVSLTGIAMPQEVALALAGILIWVAGFATPSE